MDDIVFVTLSFTREEYEVIERMASHFDMDVKTLTRKILSTLIVSNKSGGETDER